MCFPAEGREIEFIYVNLIAKMAAAFLIVVIYISLSGKGALVPISSLDQVGNMVLGVIIGGPLYNPDIRVFLLIGVSGSWAGRLLLVCYLSFKRSAVKIAVDGRSIRLIGIGRLLLQNFAAPN